MISTYLLLLPVETQEHATLFTITLHAFQRLAEDNFGQLGLFVMI